MATPFSRQGKKLRKLTVRQVLEKVECDDSDYGPEVDSDCDSDESFQPNKSNGKSSDLDQNVFVHLECSSNEHQVREKTYFKC